MPERRSPIESPCVSVCVMNAATGLCDGCFRTIDEIVGWSAMPAERRSAVMRLLPARREAAAQKPATCAEAG